MHGVRVTIFAAALTALAAPAEAKWLRADTENFIIYSEGTEKSLRTFAENLQRFDATLRVRFGLGEAQEPNRLVIYLVPRAVDAASSSQTWIGVAKLSSLRLWRSSM